MRSRTLHEVHTWMPAELRGLNSVWSPVSTLPVLQVGHARTTRLPLLSEPSYGPGENDNARSSGS
jgi:hypothetical protein